MSRNTLGFIRTNQVDPTLDSSSGIYDVRSLTNYRADGITPSAQPRDVKVLKRNGAVSNSWIIGYESVSYKDLDFDSGYHISKDGRNVYVEMAGTITHFKLNIPWDVQSLFNAGRWSMPDNESGNSNRIAFTLDDTGKHLYTHGATLDDLAQWELVTPFDISSAVFVRRVENWITSVLTSMTINDDGTKLFTQINTTVKTHTMSTPYDISTINAYASGVDFSDPSGLVVDGDFHYFGDEGRKFYMNGETLHPYAVFQWTLSTPYDLSSATFDKAQRFFDDASVAATVTGFAVGGVGSAGNKVIIGATAFSGLKEFDLETDWDIGTVKGVNEDNEFQFHGEVNPGGLYVKSDGTVAWMSYDFVDYGAGVVEYKFIDSWQASTIIHSGVFADIQSYNGGVVGIYFSSDGTKFYSVSNVNDTVIQFTLSTAWDIRTASYYATLSVAAQETVPEAITFKPDGTELYIAGATGDDVNQYTLSTPWDISTATFTAVSTQKIATDVYGIEFNDTGTVLNTTRNADLITPHALTTAWDITTLQAAGTSANIVTGETTPRNMRFKDDGTAMYVIGATQDKILKWNLSTPYDVTSIASANYDSAATYSDVIIEGGFVDSDQQYLFVCDNTNGGILRFGTEEAGNLSSKKADRDKTQYFDCSAQSTSPANVQFSTDGTKMYVLEQAADLYQYNLSTAWDITTASYIQTIDLDVQDANTFGFCFKHDGTILYTIGRSNEINWYNLSTPWDISTAVADANSGTVKLLDYNWHSIWISYDGTKLYVSGETYSFVQQFELTTPYDPTSIKWHGYQVTWTYYAAINMKGLNVSRDGTKLFMFNGGTTTGIHNYTNARMRTYTLTTPHDFSTITNNYGIKNPRDLFTLSATPYGGMITKDGDLLLASSSTYGTSLTQYKANPQPYPDFSGDLSALRPSSSLLQSANQGTFDRQLNIINGQHDIVVAAYLGDNGTKLYTMGAHGTINQYNLTTPYDINTPVYAHTYFANFDLFVVEGPVWGTAASALDCRGLNFSQDGAHMYYSKTSADWIVHFILDTPWDLSTARYKDFIDITAQEATPVGAIISTDGSKMSVVGSGNGLSIYSLDSAYHPSSATFDSDTQLSFDRGAVSYWISDENNSSISYNVGSLEVKSHSAINKTSLISGIPDQTRLFNQNMWRVLPADIPATGSDTWSTGGTNVGHYSAVFTLDGVTGTYGGFMSKTSSNVSSGFHWLGNMININETMDVGVRTATITAASSGSNSPLLHLYFKDASTKYYISSSGVDMAARWWPASTTTGRRIYYVTGENTYYPLTNYVDFQASQYITGMAFKRPTGDKIYLTYNTGLIAEYDLTTGWDLTTVVSPTNYNTSANLYRVEWLSNRIGAIDFNDDGTVLYVMGHNTTYGSTIEVFACPKPWSLSGMVRTGITIAPPYNMAADTPYKLANSLCYRNGRLFVVPWDRGLGTDWQPLQAYYIDFDDTPIDILRI